MSINQWKRRATWQLSKSCHRNLVSDSSVLSWTQHSGFLMTFCTELSELGSTMSLLTAHRCLSFELELVPRKRNTVRARGSGMCRAKQPRANPALLGTLVEAFFTFCRTTRDFKAPGPGFDLCAACALIIALSPSNNPPRPSAGNALTVRTPFDVGALAPDGPVAPVSRCRAFVTAHWRSTSRSLRSIFMFPEQSPYT